MRSSAHEEGQVLVLRNPKVAAVGVVTNVFRTAYADVSKVWDHNSLPVKVLSRIDGRDIPSLLFLQMYGGRFRHSS